MLNLIQHPFVILNLIQDPLFSKGSRVKPGMTFFWVPTFREQYKQFFHRLTYSRASLLQFPEHFCHNFPKNGDNYFWNNDVFR